MWVFFGCESVSASLLWSRYIGFGKKEKKNLFLLFLCGLMMCNSSVHVHILFS